MSKLGFSRIISITGIVFGIVFVSIIICYLYISIKQRAIQMSPYSIISEFQEAGYKIDSVLETGEFQSRLGNPEIFIIFDLYSENAVYNIRVFSYESWEIALRISRSENNIDKSVQGNYAYSFYYGRNVIQISPSDKAFGQELMEVLEARE